MSTRIPGIRAFGPVLAPVGVGRGTDGADRRWSVLGAPDDLVAAALRGTARPDGFGGTPGVAVVLGARHRPEDDALLLEAVARALAGRRRLVLLHRGAGGASLLRAAALENEGLRVAAVELPAAVPPRWPEGWDAARLVEAAGESRDELRVTEAGAVGRLGWRPVPLPERDRAPYGRLAGTALVTGGLGGLGLRAAAVLAVVHGLRPVLLDRTRPEEVTGRAGAVLHRLREAAGAVVVTADLADPAVAAGALRRVPGPVRAVVHCAGLVAGGPVARIRPEDLRELRAAKVDSLRHVLAGIDTDGLRHLVVFGSVTARSPHRHMGGYALANELLRREALCWAPRLPSCATVVAEWSLWSGAGQAQAMGAVAQARRMGMVPVALRPGMAALSRLLAWPVGPRHAAAVVVTGAGDIAFPPSAPV